MSTYAKAQSYCKWFLFFTKGKTKRQGTSFLTTGDPQAHLISNLVRSGEHLFPRLMDATFRHALLLWESSMNTMLHRVQKSRLTWTSPLGFIQIFL